MPGCRSRQVRLSFFRATNTLRCKRMVFRWLEGYRRAGMSKPKDSGRIDLRQVFHRVQEQMLANMAVSAVYEHPLSCGIATERHWINLFNRYLPQRYRATSGFVVDADGQRSRQIDLVIYDHFYSPLLFHDDSEPYI